MKRKYVIAVDFDSTLAVVDKKYNILGLISNAKEVVNWLHDEKDCVIIIWTGREGKMLKIAIDFLKKSGVKFDLVNENYDPNFKTSRKIFADFYVDDRSFDIDWLKIKNILTKKILAKEIEESAI